MPVTIDAIRSLSDDELDRFIDSGVQEKKARTERRKQETIAKIKELAESVGLPVSFAGMRGRPKGGKKLKQDRNER
jgi:hypothetical protein